MGLGQRCADAGLGVAGDQSGGGVFADADPVDLADAVGDFGQRRLVVGGQCGDRVREVVDQHLVGGGCRGHLRRGMGVRPRELRPRFVAAFDRDHGVVHRQCGEPVVQDRLEDRLGVLDQRPFGDHIPLDDHPRTRATGGLP